MSKRPYIIGAATVIVAAVVVFAYQSTLNRTIYKTEISEFDLKASLSDTAGVAPESHFILKTTAPLSPQVIAKYIKIVPEVGIDVRKIDAEENTFEIVPKDALLPDHVYTIQVDKGPLAERDFSWAYQVKAPFQLISSIPTEKAVEVPTQTGIELNFNRDVTDPQSAIKISPAVPGVFQTSQNKVRFIPNQPLAEKTIYTITIGADLKAKGSADPFKEKTTIQFQTGQSFVTERTQSAYFLRQFSEFKPGADVVFGIGAYKADFVGTNVYRFDSVQEYLDSVKKAQGDAPWARYANRIEGLLPDSKRAFTGRLPVQTENYSSSIRMPQALQNGYYAIVITAGQNSDISWFQVSPAASFAALSSVKSMIWLKDIASGSSLSGTPIFFGDKQIGTTNAEGVLLFDTPAELIRKPSQAYSSSERKFFIARLETGALAIPVESQYGYAPGLTERDSWWDYISFNKNLYLPTDTLRYWAIAKPRTGSAGGEKISVRITTPYWNEETDSTVTYAEATTTLSEYHTVTGELAFTNLKPGTYDVTFRRGGETIAKQTMSVSAYLKPAYKLTLTPDKYSVFAGETVAVKVKAEFFDGTPVANTTLTYTAYGAMRPDSKGDILLDSEGEATFAITPEYDAEQRYWPSYVSVSVRPSKGEEGQIYANSWIYVFGPRVNNTISQKQTSANVIFSVKTREVVANGAARGQPYWDPAEYLGGPVAGATTKADISEVIYLRDQTGTGYDPISKLSYPVYRYRTEDRAISSQTMTADQSGSAQLSFVPEDKKTYKIVFTTYDGDGRPATETRYVYGGYGEIDFGKEDYSYTLANPEGYKNYKIGEPVNLQLQTYEGIVPPQGSGNYLFMVVHNGEIEYQIQNAPRYSATFEAKHVPNIGVWPVWWSNGRFHDAYAQYVSFDANERRLNVAVKKDKESYKPGETVRLDVRVTDKNNNPVKAEVNLSALDEAVFSIRTDEKDTVNDLYRDVFSQVVIRSSNEPPSGHGGAEKGGGGDDSYRLDIQEMAIFRSVATDSGGNAHVEFKLPDNITSWRLTSQAVTKDLFAGKDVYFIPVTLPLFVDATLNDTYLAGDEVILRLRAFGSAASQGATSFTVESSTLPWKKIERTGGNGVEIPLGSLSLGTHEITIAARAGGLSDALVRKLRVVDSYFTKDTSDFYEGVAGLKVANDASGNTTLTMSSLGQGRLYSDLKYLGCQCGMRLDQKGSGLIAASLLNQYFGENRELPEFPSAKYQSFTGGMRLLPYGSDELELSAIAAHLFPPSAIDRASLKTYLTNSLTDSKSDPSRIARALFGLASYNEPVLSKIQSLKNDRSLALKDKIFIALALDAIGAKEEARAYYRQSIMPFVESAPSYAYAKGLNKDETILATNLLAALSASLEEPESTQFALYAQRNHPQETLDNFERLLYIKKALPKLDSGEVSFSYRSTSKNGVKTLKNGETFKLVLTPADLESFELSEVKGKLGVVASYERRSEPGSVQKDPNLSINRSYEVDGQTTTEFNDGDIVTVRLSPSLGANALTGNYQIVDYLPSGLRPIDRESGQYESSYATRTYPAEIDGQKVTFVIGGRSSPPIYYLARVVSKGVYKAEPALLQSLRNVESAAVSSEASITIK